MTLDVVGLDEVEQRVYEAVLAHQPATMADLRHACGVEELQLVLVAKGLASKSLISEVAGAGQFVAAPPEIAVEALLLDKEAQIKRARLLVQRLAKLHDATAVRMSWRSRIDRTDSSSASGTPSVRWCRKVANWSEI